MEAKSKLEKFKEKQAKNPYAILGGKKDGPIDRSEVSEDDRD